MSTERLIRDRESLRRTVGRLARRLRQERLEAEVAILQAHRQHAPPWDQHIYTEAIDQLRAGNRYPRCLTTAQEIEQMDREHEQHLDECRRILRRFKQRRKECKSKRREA